MTLREEPGRQLLGDAEIVPLTFSGHRRCEASAERFLAISAWGLPARPGVFEASGGHHGLRPARTFRGGQREGAPARVSVPARSGARRHEDRPRRDSRGRRRRATGVRSRRIAAAGSGI